MDLLDRLLEHDRWATAYLLSFSRDLTDAQLDQPFDIGHQTLRTTLEHVIYYVDFWTALMAGRSQDPLGDDHSLTALAEWHERSFVSFAAFARQVHEEQRLDASFVDHFGGNMTFGGAILHVILHNTEHRTEAVHIIERLGVSDVPEVDHGLWDYERRGL